MSVLWLLYSTFSVYTRPAFRQTGGWWSVRSEKADQLILQIWSIDASCGDLDCEFPILWAAVPETGWSPRGGPAETPSRHQGLRKCLMGAHQNPPTTRTSYTFRRRLSPPNLLLILYSQPMHIFYSCLGCSALRRRLRFSAASAALRARSCR